MNANKKKLIQPLKITKFKASSAENLFFFFKTNNPVIKSYKFS